MSTALPTLLITGFEPFGAHGYNPSQHVLQALSAEGGALPGVRVVTRLLPVTFADVSAQVPALLAELRPAAFVGLGLRGSGVEIDLERIALNLDDCQAPDNAGMQPQDLPAVPGGPPLFRSTLPLGAMLAALQAERLPARISNHAGTYVCNHLFYVARHALAGAGLDIPCGFIHVPQVREGRAAADAGAAEWSQSRLNAAVRTAVAVVAAQVAQGGPSTPA